MAFPPSSRFLPSLSQLQGYGLRTHGVISTSTGLQYYHLSLSGRVSSSRFLDCIDRVMNQRIEQVELDFYTETDCLFDLPPSLFNCNTLKALKFNNNHCLIFSWCRDFRFPAPVLFPALHTLCLTNIWLEACSEVFLGSNFPLLRKLCLNNCLGMTDLNINCPGLEILKLEDLRLKGLDISGTGLLELQAMGCLRYTGGWAKILAPNLQWLHWKDAFNVKCVTESFEDLNMGSVHFSYLPLSSQNPATLQSAASFISALCFARSLNVRSGVLKILSTMDSEDRLPFCFKNLTTLETRTHLTKYRTTGIICLLRSPPILRTISIGVNCSEHVIKSWDDDQYWRSQSQNINSTERQLKFAKIEVGGSKMPESALHLVKFLLRYETALQEMTLTLKIDPPSKKKNLKD